MGTLGAPEMMLIFVLALLLFGPKKLPEIGRTIGKAITEFRKASSELKDTFHNEMQNLERETQSVTEAANPYQGETYNYDYSSYESSQEGSTPEAGAVSTELSSESASAPQGAELPSAEAPEGVVAYGSEHETPVSAEPAAEHSEAAPAPEAASVPADPKA